MTQQTIHNIIEITDANFETTIQSQQPVLIDFWATWCGPCRVIAPILEELAQEVSGKFVIGKLDVGQNAEISTRYGVRIIPTLIIFKNGKEVERLLGSQHTKSALKAKLEKHA